MKVEAAHWTDWRMEAKAKWRAKSKICAPILQETKTKKKQNSKMSRLSFYKKIEINAFKWKNRRNGRRARRLQMGCNMIEWNLWDTSQTHGSRKIRQQTWCWNHAEQEVEAKNYWYWIHQRTGHHRHDRGKPPTHQTDECVLLPLGMCGPSHRKNVHGTECKSVGRYTLDEGNKRGDWMEHWLMLQEYTALNTWKEKHLRNKRPSYLQKVTRRTWTTY